MINWGTSGPVTNNNCGLKDGKQSVKLDDSLKLINLPNSFLPSDSGDHTKFCSLSKSGSGFQTWSLLCVPIKEI